MTVEARWNGVVIAASDKTVLVEGNHYFPPEDVLARFHRRKRIGDALHVEGRGQLLPRRRQRTAQCGRRVVLPNAA